MSYPEGRSDRHPDHDEPVTVTDKRRIDPQTGAVREGSFRPSGSAPGPAPSGPAPGAAPGAQEAAAEKIAELTGDLQRVQADFTNYRKRALRDQDMAAERAKAVVVNQLLPVLDDLDRARRHGDLDSGPLKSVADKLVTVLSGLGLVAFGVEGEPFDPSMHEAVQHEGDGSNPVLGTVMRQGFKLGDFVLRPAMVGVVDAVEADTATGLGGTETAESHPQSAESDQ